MDVRPKSSIDRAAFEKLRRIAPAAAEANRTANEPDWRPRNLPDEVAFKLTNRCDLRCDHCYQWNEFGYHHDLEPHDRHGDLDLSIVARVLAVTRELQSNVYIWGGEPLIYRDWDGLIDILHEHRRWTSICTNGTLLARRLSSLCRISERLELVIALDGFEAEHDSLRGSGSFRKTLGGLRALIEAKHRGSYLGEITVNCVFQDAMLNRLLDFVTFLEQEGVETVYLSFPWYLSDGTSQLMDEYVAHHHPHLTLRMVDTKPSWYSYKFKLDPSRLDDLRAELLRINTAVWRIKVRYNPELDSADLEDFILGSHRPAQNKSRCLALQSRLDVFPNGNVVSCKFFPEFSVGNLERSDVRDVWESVAFNRVRKAVADNGLMPVCAKCNLLYTRGV
ncbi:MAG: hypothetical protein QOJ19_1115 [Acidimicrobiia bacterium]|jgi:radical SAM protein with 4Fe4S-binding SPASM domain|nr:hypothetical protein [Acidimicrobiia bacterium]